MKKLVLAALGLVLLLSACQLQPGDTDAQPTTVSRATIEQQNAETQTGLRISGVSQQTSIDRSINYSINLSNFSINETVVDNSIYLNADGSKIVKYALDDLHSEVVYQAKSKGRIVQVAMFGEDTLVVALAAPSFDGQPRSYYTLNVNEKELKPLELEGIENAVQVRLFALDDMLIYDAFMGEGVDNSIYQRKPNGETAKLATGCIDYLFDGKIYFFTHTNNDLTEPKHLFRCNLDGSEHEVLGIGDDKTLIFGDTRVTVQGGYQQLFSYDGRYLYYYNIAGVQQMNVESGTVRQLIDGRVNDLIVVDGWIYYVMNGTLQRQEASSAATTKAEATTKLPTTHSSTTRWMTWFTTQRATNVTTIRVWDAPFQTKELKTFYEKHKKTMQELSEILIAHDVKVLNISSGVYDGDPIDEKRKETFFTFLSTVGAETSSDPQIGVGVIEKKRLITFGFTTYYGEASICYMPDGYVRVPDREPEVNEIIYSHESKLANNWYSYWW
jgi:hypothetical protein